LLQVICARPSVSVLPVVRTSVYCPLAMCVSVAALASAVSVPPFLDRDKSPMTAPVYSAPVESRTGPTMSVAAVDTFASMDAP
jgi:hypothetical protein